MKRFPWKLLPLALLVAIAFRFSTDLLPAADAPKPGPEQKKLEMLVGEWAYEGSGVATPFLEAAGSFKGKYTCRMVLGGFFLEGRGEDVSDNHYVYQDIWLTGFDPRQNKFVTHYFENDGNTSVGTLTVSNNTWTAQGSRMDSKGRVYLTRSTDVYASDGKSAKSVCEYSSDGGKTWLPAWSYQVKKVGP